MFVVVQESHIACTSDVGRAEFRFEHKSLQLWSIIGRSVVVHDYDNLDERFAFVLTFHNFFLSIQTMGYICYSTSAYLGI